MPSKTYDTCNTCKWWTKHIDGKLDGIPEEKGDCDKVGTEGEDSFDTVANNDENSFLITGPKFGCIQHESNA